MSVFKDFEITDKGLARKTVAQALAFRGADVARGPYFMRSILH